MNKPEWIIIIFNKIKMENALNCVCFFTLTSLSIRVSNKFVRQQNKNEEYKSFDNDAWDAGKDSRSL